MYKSKKRQREYMKKWRQKRPGYMSKYYQEKVKPLRPKKVSLAFRNGRLVKSYEVEV